MQPLRSTLICILLLTMTGCESDPTNNAPTKGAAKSPTGPTQLATFGGGCFWCVEAVFELVDGVVSATSGYAGGHVANPTYKAVCTGETGHAEVVQLEFNPARVSYEQLLDLFWIAHDPTTLNRQGPDEGTQYRSIILCSDDVQKVAAEKSKAAAQAKFSQPIVTEIVPLTKFYSAEGYHQDYFRNNPQQPYCSAAIAPKVAKLRSKIEELNAKNAGK
jgi:peptide-methionine (S)-S-oxide reductase